MGWRWLSPGERIRRQAATWIARREGSLAPAERQEFEKWLDTDQRHRDAYERISGHYAQAGMLQHSEIGRQRGLDEVTSSPTRALAPRLATAAIALSIGIGAISFISLGNLPVQAMSLSTQAQMRQFELVDGSKVTLFPGSEVAIEITRQERRARLRNGRARFEIAPEKRRFIVIAGEDLRDVAEGRIDALMVDGKGTISVDQARSAIGDRESAPAILQFSSTPIGQVVERANLASPQTKIILDPGAFGHRVTGQYKEGDVTGLAESLAAAFNLTMIERGSTIYLGEPIKK